MDLMTGMIVSGIAKRIMMMKMIMITKMIMIAMDLIMIMTVMKGIGNG